MQGAVRYKSLRLFQLRFFPFGESLLLKSSHASPNIRLSHLMTGGTIDFAILVQVDRYVLTQSVKELLLCGLTFLAEPSRTSYIPLLFDWSQVK